VQITRLVVIWYLFDLLSSLP